jgi:integrase
MRGSVRRRGSTWGYIIDVAPDPATGKRRQRTKGGFATKRAAEEAMRKAIAAGSAAGGDAQKLGDYLNEWLSSVEPRLRGTTASSYRIAVDRIKAGLGAVRLRDLTPLMIEHFYADLVRMGGKTGRGLSAKSVRNTHVVLRKALADGERLELLVRNPAARAKPPTGERKETPTWTASELTMFLAGVVDDPLYALWVVLATTGLRRGEALGLRWSDVDLERGTLSVSQTITTIDNKIAVTPPKSDRSRRRIGLDTDTVRVLRDHRRAQARDLKLLGSVSSPLVFTDEDGGPIHPDHVTRRFQRLVRRSGLPPLRGPHDLRHTWASLALAAGVHPKVVSDRLGHSTIAITIDTYSHAIPSLDADAAAMVASQLFAAG